MTVSNLEQMFQFRYNTYISMYTKQLVVSQKQCKIDTTTATRKL